MNIFGESSQEKPLDLAQIPRDLIVIQAKLDIRLSVLISVSN